LRLISRLTVDGDRPSDLAIDRIDRFATMPLDISSRSERLNANRDRRRGAGRMPPCGASWKYIDDEGLPNTRPIALNDSPRCQRSHNSVFSAVLNPRQYLCFICTHSILAFKIKCCVVPLRPPLESGHSADRITPSERWSWVVLQLEQSLRILVSNFTRRIRL